MIPWPGKSKPPEAQVLDLTYLERLSGHLGTEIAAEILADGMLELSDRLDRVQELAEAGERDALLRLTHDIAGASGHLGLSAMSQGAMAVNRELRTAGDKSFDQMVQPLLNLRNSSIEALGHYCRSALPSTRA